MYVTTAFILGLPVPIVVVSAAISHEQYGINDRFKNMMHVHNLYVLYHCNFT